jgi:hypothetical protein
MEIAKGKPAMGNHDHHHHTPASGEHRHGAQSLDHTAFHATVHCLTGCAIGEVLGMVIGTALGFTNLATVVLAVVLAFFLGYALTLIPLIRSSPKLDLLYRS